MFANHLITSSSSEEHESESEISGIDSEEEEEDSPLGAVTLTGDWDLEQAIRRNTHEPEIVESCAHHLFENRAKLQPNASAIDAWDQTFNYGDLEAAANRLAHYLVNTFRVGVGDLVHVCFEKSAWFIVAILAINKAGAAWVPLDPAHPVDRQRQVVRQTAATLALASPATAEMCASLVTHVVEVTQALDMELDKDPESSSHPPICEVSPRNAAYVLFTSGSTGTPKGCVIEHRSICTSQKAICKRLGVTTDVRMLQFASYVFDLCVGEIFAPLISGACVCIPSDYARLNDLKGFIHDMNVNWAILTPSFARTLYPDDAPNLKLLVLAGEAISHDVFNMWFGKVRLVNGWGPAETCVFSALHEWKSASESPLTIGQPVGGSCWIVDPQDPSKLAPIGCIGEVVIQGPTLLREYLSNPEATEAAILTRLPEWAPRRLSPHWNRFYKTGDLCSYNADGTIEFSSRKDTQVKIRGLRVELSEVEHHIQASLDGLKQTAVDVFETEAGSNLVSYLCFSDELRIAKKTGVDDRNEDVFLPLTTGLEDRIAAMIGYLKMALPRYMIPTLFIPCRYMPLSTSGKLDRNKLRTMTTMLEKEQLDRYHLLSSQKRVPETEMEIRMQKIWSRILNIPQDSIGRDDSFLHIGGDSISAIRLVGLARDVGIVITVKNILDDSRLCAVAASATNTDGDVIIDIAPFGLLPRGLDVDVLQAHVDNQCELSPKQTVEDAYPCTQLQEGLIALAVKQPGSYIAQHVFQLPKHIDVQRFKAAWEQTVDICSNLRTRIVLVDGSSIQIVVKNDIGWDATGSHNALSYLSTTRDFQMEHGSKLCRYALIEELDSEHYFVWAIHHAIFDGWTMTLISKILYQVYYDMDVQVLVPYNSFVRYTTGLDDVDNSEYWNAQLRGAMRATFPPFATTATTSERLVKRTIPFPRPANFSITKATVLRAAWAIVLARYCNTDDVCFGTTISGRHASVPGVDRIAGLTIATVPVRVQMDGKQSVSDFLTAMQNQSSVMVDYEQYGLQNISKVSTDAKDACDFSSLLVIEQVQQMYGTDDNGDNILLPVTHKGDVTEEWMKGYFTYPLVVQALVLGNEVELCLTYDPNVLNEAQLVGLCHHFDHVTQQLLTKSETLLNDIQVASQWDLNKAIEWNSEDPGIIESCIHQLFEEQARLRPDAIAIDAWDHSFTYSQLDAAANRLAHHLITTFGVRLDELVHVCFEKSAWFIVAILAINKAGAAWVPLDPAHPVDRQRQVVRQTAATLALASPATAEMCASLVTHVVEVTQALDMELDKDPESSSHPPICEVSPRNAAYVLFTSGSTGTPKGCVIEHRSICTSQKAICKRLGVTTDVRMLQFASYVFDLCVGEIFAPLISGACVCIPSDYARLNDLKGFIHDMNVNWAILTPSFARTLYPDDAPNLKLLVLAGEAISHDVFNMWFGKVRLVNGWGPAETCVFSALHEWKSASESPLTIGQPVGGSCWIVDPQDPSKLAPIGCIGEVVIQGPTLLREYLSNPEATEAAILTRLPEWAPRRLSPHWNRFYKTGDLCSYNADGTIEFSSRKDTQVKIRGLRVELSEVEHHIQAGLPGVQHVAVDVLRTESGVDLVSYFCFNKQTVNPQTTDIDNSSRTMFLPLTAELEYRINAMIGHLNLMLPGYMIPTIFIPCCSMPFINSAKLDRNKLRTMTSTLSLKELQRYSLLKIQKRAPETEMEFRMQKMWAQTLNIPQDAIGRDDSFLRVGGDSLKAIGLVSSARDAGISLAVNDIFNDPRLLAMAAAASTIDDQFSFEIRPFSLLPAGIDANVITSYLHEQGGLATGHTIDDAYVCTKLQEGLMALTVKQPKSYIAKYIFRLSKNVDVRRFKAAWEQTVLICSNLRTRIMLLQGSSIQVIMKNDIVWESTGNHNILSFLSATEKFEMTYSSSLSRYALIKDEKGTTHFIWAIHHSVFDGWTVGIVMQVLYQAYHDVDVPALPPYNGFISYTMGLDQDAASEYWKTQLYEAKRATFPPSSNTHVSSGSLVESNIAFSQSTNSSITKATVLRAAWSIVLALYCESNDVCFGTTVSGRHASVPGVERMAGPAVATVPVRVRLNSEQSVSDFLHDIQNQATEMVAYEQYGLQNISKVSAEAKDVCDFSSLLIIQPVQQMYSTDDVGGAILALVESADDVKKESMEGYFTYPLVVQALIMNDKVELKLAYDSNVLNEAQLVGLCHHFDHVTQQLLTKSETLLNDIQVASQWDLNKAIERNSEDPGIIESCIHQLFEEQARLRPDAIAIDAWDHSFTYSQLDAAANRLAHHLITTFGVRLDELVHVCFEKSAWFIVAILAINKAGAAWVPLDPAHPVDRQRQVVRQTAATLALASPATAEMCASLVTHVVEVTQALDMELDKDPESSSHPPICEVSPRNAAYVLFTSGSTGTPKGCVIEHRSICTSQKAICKRLGVTTDVRMLQFASYVFDLCVGEIFAPLISGACVCIPSDYARLNDLKGFIHDMNVNWAILTPSFARTLYPDDAPNLKLLVLAGEAISHDVFNMWFGKVRLVNGWGPAETCVFSALHEWKSASESPLTIGQPVGGSCWIVDPQDPSKLAPIGCIGEVVIQGPTLLREYLSNPEATEAAILTRLPEWAPRRLSPHWNRFYKTGDLCSYNADGTIEFSSRKDTQVKIRGLRVELSEVEHHIQASLDGLKQTAVDVFETEAGSNLVSYLCFGDDKELSKNKDNSEGIFLPLTASLESQITSMIGYLKVTLPQYMIPTLFIPCRYMPLNNSAKLERAKLRRLTTMLTREQLQTYSLLDSYKRAPETDMEFRVQKLWAEILNVPEASIGRDDSFLHIGGDSISAIRLVGVAHDAGISFSVKNIFDDPRLSAVAAAAVTTNGDTIYETEPFSLLPPTVDVPTLSVDINKQCKLSSGQTIQDAFPCTKLQEGLIALAVKQPGSHIANNMFRLPEHIDMHRFRAAWERTVEICTNLRTRIVMFEDSSIQVLIKNDIAWEVTDGHDMASFMNIMRTVEMEYGSRLCRYALVNDADSGYHFVWTVHHAVFDGWTTRIVLQTLHQAYHDVDIPAIPPYSGFVKHTMSLDREAASDYWKIQLHEAKRATFPPSSNTSISSGSLVKKTIAFPYPVNSSITKATILRAAWAIVLARYCDTDDICFGTSVSGRHASVVGIERMAGLAVSTVPIRIRLDSQQFVSNFLGDIQNQASDMVAFEQYGLQNISKLNVDAKDACDFSSLLVIQPVRQMYSTDQSDAILVPVDSSDQTTDKGIEGYFTYPVVTQAFIMDDQVDLHLTYDSSVLTEGQLVTLCHQYEHVTQQLMTRGETPLSSISLTGQWDLDQAIQRNSDEPEVVESCIHQLIESQAKLRPQAIAIDAWDHSFTYGQLNAAANRLAHYLVGTFGVRTDDLVHVCFEKSAWFVVAILAVNKAGAAWVPLDPSHPIDRQRQIVQQTSATLALASPTNAQMCASLVADVITVSSALDTELSISKETSLQPPISDVSPHNAAYGLFTSGSTGVPKGFVLEHKSVCTSQKAIAHRMRVTQDVRLLQFSSYVFDFCIAEIIFSLVSGACICIPSEHTRLNRLKEFILEMNINWLFLTPSVARMLHPDDFPNVEVLFLAGEAVGRDVFDTWFGRVRLLNGWGPAETCVSSALHEWTSVTESPLTVGRSVGGYCWIVDPQDPQKLAPIGCVGEVVIQGPTLLREYLSNPKATQDAIMTTLPEWAPRRSLSHWNRFYKTGDLCSYNADGTIEFVSRKDTQVKIRGLRVELSEVEHHMRTSTQSLHDVAVDVLKTDGGASLVSYLCFGETREIPEGTDINKTRGDIFLPLTTNLESQITAMVGYLNVTLPRYMIPTIFIPCRYIPLINSAKIDRNKLRTWTSMLDRKQLDRYSLLGDQKRAPETQMEIRMQKVWAEILQVPAETIGRDDSFLRMGGDSISVIRLVGLARDSGIDITVKAIFDDPRLSVVAAAAADIDRMTLSTIEPFSLLPPSVNIDAFTASIREQCGLPINQTIEDAYPCTQLQEGLMALAVKQPGSYIGRYTFRLPEHVDVQRFKTAWEQTVAICDNLRTQIVLFEGYSLQVLIEDDIAWEQSSGCDVQSFTKMMRATAMTYSSRLSRYALIEEESGKNYFCWTSHHAINDGWTVRIIVRTLSQAYHAMEIPPLEPYNVFIKYTMDLDQRAAAEYWKAQLLDAKRATFPLTSSTTASSTSTSIHSTGVVKKTIPFPTTPNTSITKATILRAAWALILARYCDTDDVCFGTTISGRHAHVYGVERMAGAVLTTVPVRVRLDSRKSVATFLSDVQNQALEMIAYEQYGLQNISKVSMDARDACDFSSLLVIQPAQQMDTLVNMPDTILLETDSDDRTGEAPLEGYFSYPLVIQCLIFDEHIELHLTYDSTILDEIQLTALCNQFANVTQQLHKKLEKTPVKSRRRLKRITTQH